ncbi:MAG TPA: peptidoglycan-binding domain-containing protein [Gemmatimonadaceae bacterium]|nr:peptidoglycan-binding domain-containing protein [Gemmatimonadaceae bacterium]
MRSSTLIHGATWAAALSLCAAVALPAQSRVLPAGSVIIVRTTSPIQSSTAKQGDTFETTVEESVGVDEFTIIPSGSRIRGVMAMVTPATRQQSGVIDVVFDRLMLPDGSVIQIAGRLTSTDTTERRQIKANANARVVLVGGRGGIGAAIAGAGASSRSNNILAALGEMLSEGRDVNVPAGTALAVELDRAVSLRSRGRMAGRNIIYTAPERVRAAQQSLARAGYYRGAASGTLDDATRRALFEYQVDRGLRGTGNLDAATAQALGVNVAAGLSGAVLATSDATTLRRDAQALLARHRAELGASAVGQLNATRGYTQGDLELWFALSAFADNAGVYEQVVINGGNRDAAVLAGRALLAAARRVDAAMQNARVSAPLQNGWTSTRRRLSPIESSGD